MKNLIKNLKVALVIITSLIYNLCANDFCYHNKDENVIHLIGEDHIDQECIKLRNFLKNESNSENIILALESIFSNQKEGRIHGIEEGNLYILSNAWSIYKYLVLYKITHNFMNLDKEPSGWTWLHDMYLTLYKSMQEAIGQSKEKIDFLELCPSYHFDIDNEFDHLFSIVNYAKNFQELHLNNKEILDVFESFNIFQIIDFIKNLKQNGQQVSNNEEENIVFLIKAKKFNEFMKIESKEPRFLRLHDNIFQWINLFKDIVVIYLQENYQKGIITLDLMNQGIACVDQLQKYVEIDLEKNPDAISSIKEEYKLKFNVLWKELTMVLRDQAFLKNIINIFENNKYHKKPFYVIVGALHIPFLYEELMSHGYTVELNDWAQVEYEKYYIEELKNPKKSYDEESVKQIIKFATQKINHKRFDFQLNSLVTLIRLGENKLLNKNVLDIPQLIPLLIEKLNHESYGMQTTVLYLIYLLIDNKLIDKETLGINELTKDLRGQLHNDRCKTQDGVKGLLQLMMHNGIIDKKL